MMTDWINIYKVLRMVPTVATFIFHQIDGHNLPLPCYLKYELLPLFADINNTLMNIFVWLGLELSVIVFISDVSLVGTSKGKFLKGGEVLKGNLGMDTSLIPSRESVFLSRAPSVAILNSTSLLAYMLWLLELHWVCSLRFNYGSVKILRYYPRVVEPCGIFN